LLVRVCVRSFASCFDGFTFDCPLCDALEALEQGLYYDGPFESILLGPPNRVKLGSKLGFGEGAMIMATEESQGGNTDDILLDFD